MILDEDAARKTAELLLQIKAIKLRPENPFTWASGWKSPIYCDNRILLSYPKIRREIRDELAKQVRQLYGEPDLIVGVATGAIGIGMLVAEALDLPFAYVRPKPKAHGRQNQIEGKANPGQTTVVIEDLISTGMSSLQAVKALRESNIEVQGMLGIFSYGFPVSKENFEAANVQLHTLSDYEHLIALAESSGYIQKEKINTLREWRADPQHWTP